MTRGISSTVAQWEWNACTQNVAKKDIAVWYVEYQNAEMSFESVF